MVEESMLHIVKNGHAVSMNFEDLFDSFKYSRIRCVSYVSSPKFLSRLITRFEEATVILGIDQAEPLAGIDEFFRGGNIKRFNALGEKARDMVSSGACRLLYGDGMTPIHSKIYLLDGKDSTRVMVGSANLTETAFGLGTKSQYEELLIFDDRPSMFEEYEKRFTLLETTAIDVIPKECKDVWRDKKILIDAKDAEVVARVVKADLKGVDKDKIVETFLATQSDFESLSETVEVDPKALSASEVAKLEVVRQLKVRSKDGRFELKSGQPLSNAVDKVIKTVIEMEAEVEDEASLEGFPFLVQKDFGDEQSLWFGHGFSAEDLMTDKFTPSEKLSKKELKRQLKNVEAFLDTYVKYSKGIVDDAYLAKLYEAILFTLMGPFFKDVRKQVAESAVSGGELSNIPLFLAIGGVQYSGKTSLLSYLYKMACGEKFPDTVFTGMRLSTKHLFGRNLRKCFQTGNRFPTFIDEVQPSYFKGKMGSDTIKSVANELVDEEYAPVICTTNAGEYNEADGVGRRVLYLQIDQAFDDQDMEGRRARDAVIAACDGKLMREFATRFIEHEKAGDKLYGHAFQSKTASSDYLMMARMVVSEMYKDAGRKLPSYFPYEAVGGHAEDDVKKWRLLWEYKPEIFELRGNGKTLCVNQESIFGRKMTGTEQSQYVTVLPPAVNVGPSSGVYLELDAKKFCKWIGVDKPRVKSKKAKKK